MNDLKWLLQTLVIHWQIRLQPLAALQFDRATGIISYDLISGYLLPNVSYCTVQHTALPLPSKEEQKKI